MRKEITQESYREEKLAEIKATHDWVTENYNDFWRLAREASRYNFQPFRIETHYGDWIFNPAPKSRLED